MPANFEIKVSDLQPVLDGGYRKAVLPDDHFLQIDAVEFSERAALQRTEDAG